MTDDDDSPEPRDLQPEDGIGNAADPEAMRVAREKREEHASEAERFWRGVLVDPVGRREIWKLLQSAHTFEQRFACGPNGAPQPESTWFQAGEQSFGLNFYLMLQFIDREGVWRMQDEHDSRYARPAKPKRSRRKAS
jgi:hypothetical protein